MKEEIIADIAEALYHPEHIADDLYDIFEEQDVDYDILINIVVEHLEQLVRDRYNKVEFELDHDKIDNCGVEFTSNTLDEFKQYIIRMQFNVGDELDEMLEESL